MLVDGRPTDTTRTAIRTATVTAASTTSWTSSSRSALDAAVKERAAALFRRLAEAEAAVHGTSPEAVHFHEVGAVDSIVDVVGGVMRPALAGRRALRGLAAQRRHGHGHDVARHLPGAAAGDRAPASRACPSTAAGEGELLTPTGALLVTAYADRVRPAAAAAARGDRATARARRDTPGRPNVLRLIVGEEDDAAPSERVLVLETEIDDMPPQLYGPLLDRLLDAGALDAFFTPMQMKKGRPGVLVTVLAPPRRREAIEEVLFARDDDARRAPAGVGRARRSSARR